MAVASAGPYASLHLADQHASTPPFSFFSGRMPFRLPNQQRQSTEGTTLKNVSSHLNEGVDVCSVQSKSLVGDSSIVFSPPSIVAETLHDDTVFESKKSSVGLCNSEFQVPAVYQLQQIY